MSESEIVKSKEAFKKEARERAYRYELQFHGCSQSVLLPLQELLGLEHELTFKAASALCSGVGASKTCGALLAGVMVLGMKHGRAQIQEGLGSLVKGLELAQKLVRKFEQQFGTTSCYEISGIDWTDEKAVMEFLNSQERIEKCAQVVGKTAEMVAELLSEEGSPA
ncbi:MAG: C_GCAxxG_C_C family protein [Dehalococcoidia bacterium]|jgi:C_GCAxxG_C_C family probable redox protein|nr:C_GCAxxG_C_C family protein [Chloroflexota bacterium]MCK4242788.1 C_GCAxxG_C_C family protein [Dehalococcoidia bacterium]